MGGKYRRPRIMFICSEETKNELETWAKEENRTLSNLVEMLADEAVAKRKAARAKVKQRPKQLTIAWLIKQWTDINQLSLRSGINADSLKEYIQGKYPSNKHIVLLDCLLEHPDDGHLIDTSELLDLRDATFGKNGNGNTKKEQPNGA